MIDREGKIAFVRAAVDSDVDRIYEIATEQSATINPTSGAIEGSGLVSGYDKATYRRSVNLASYFLVLVQDGTITSFMLAFDSQDAAPEEIKLEEVRQLISERDRHREVEDVDCTP
jgi:hypothetical protein